MAITQTEFLTDRVRVHYSCKTPWGSKDDLAVVEVPYESILALPGLPLDHGRGEHRAIWEETIYVPAANATVVFRFATWQESDDCRMEAFVGGPFLRNPAESAAA